MRLRYVWTHFRPSGSTTAPALPRAGATPQKTIDGFGWALAKTGKHLSGDKLLVAATAAKARRAASDVDAALEKVGIKRTLNMGCGDTGEMAD